MGLYFTRLFHLSRFLLSLLPFWCCGDILDSLNFVHPLVSNIHSGSCDRLCLSREENFVAWSAVRELGYGIGEWQTFGGMEGFVLVVDDGCPESVRGCVMTAAHKYQPPGGDAK